MPLPLRHLQPLFNPRRLELQCFKYCVELRAVVVDVGQGQRGFDKEPFLLGFAAPGLLPPVGDLAARGVQAGLAWYAVAFLAVLFTAGGQQVPQIVVGPVTKWQAMVDVVAVQRFATPYTANVMSGTTQRFYFLPN